MIANEVLQKLIDDEIASCHERMRQVVATARDLADRGIVRREFADRMAAFAERAIAGDDQPWSKPQ